MNARGASLDMEQSELKHSIIQGIFFAEFDNIVGPKLVYQWPPDCLSNDEFEAIDPFIITGADLANKIISLVAFDRKIVGFPCRIEHSKYHRNALLFNFCFVLPVDCQTASFEPILRKLAASFSALEVESQFISNPASKCLLQDMLPRLFNGLNERGECVLSIDAANAINLKLFPQNDAPPDVFDHQVPLLTKDLSVNMTSDWDLALQEILPFMDGLRHVKRIAADSNVDIELVRACVRQLLFYRCASLIDIFQFSDVYCTTSSISRLASNPRMQRECLDYISNDPPPFDRVFALYCSLQRGFRVKDFSHNLAALGIDPARFIIFGTVNGFVRRLYEFPVLLNPPSTASTDSNMPVSAERTLKQVFGDATGAKIPADFGARLCALLDGAHSLDEICCALNIPDVRLRVMLQQAAHLALVSK